MLVQVDLSKVKNLPWPQYAIRFALGGLITATAGILAEKFGPAIGGLFLAFPAIFPASVTLVEKTERDRKRNKGLSGDKRARAAATLDTHGAALGSVALMPFAVLIWLSVARYPPWMVLLAATTAWTGSAVAAWAAARWFRHRHALSRANNHNGVRMSPESIKSK
jgi:Protein of unknown function (DUF3147)